MMHETNANTDSPADENFWRQAKLPVHSTIEQAIGILNKVALKIVLLVNEAGCWKGRFLTGIFDADYSRAWG